MENQTVVIEQTSKRLKRQLLIAVAALLLGIGLIVFGASGEAIWAILSGAALTVGGLVWLGVTKCRIWWQHR